MKNLSLIVFLLLALSPLTAQIPSGYYNTASGLNGQALFDALHQIIDDHTRFPYSSSSTDTWDILGDADEDPNNASNVLLIYKNSSVGDTSYTSSQWNREHSWPKSLGFPDDGSCNYPYTDTHHLFASNPSYNAARSNKPFAFCLSGCTTYTVTGSTDVNKTSGDFTAGSWEAWDDVKGDLARAMFYMAVRYEGGTHGLTGCSEPDLKLTDDRSLINNVSNNASEAYMGMLSDLITWHNQDPVDDAERFRNDVIYSYQGNRNPFVDHPEYVAAILDNGGSFGTAPTGGGGGGGNGGGGNGGGGGGTGTVWINEIHYDNSSTDVNEGVEIAGPAGTSLSGYSLVAYNGSGGSSYSTTNLSGTLTDQSNGFGFAWFNISLQNGGPDGIALVDSTGSVVEFLSYEGSFTASGGPANGIASTDIGVSESSSTPSGYSLQLGGSGSSGADFSWQSESVDTPNAVNNSQTFSGGGSGGGGGGTPTTGDVWINEIHYDNSSTDFNEGVEIAGPAGSNLSGFSLVAYNGSNGDSYSTTNLSGTLSDQSNGFGTLWFAISGLQNGSPDGIALVDDTGAVIQFLSYEGSFTANNGPAAGLASDDIGVSESSSTSSSQSLQLGGSGSAYADFVWEMAAAHTRNLPNGNQTFTGSGGGSSADPWINEFHYDDSGSDSNEGIEVAGPAGTDLSGWTLVGYNGSNGSSYKTVNLSGVLPNSQNGSGQIWFAFSGLQNGSPDGMALVDDSGVVIQFLSYEGSFTANNGPAAGLTSENVGVSESSGGSSNNSLQLTGSGSSYADFTWANSQTNTRNAKNTGQTYQ